MSDEYRLGDILVRQGHLTATMLQDALRTQNGTRLGQALVTAGVVTQRQVDAAVKVQELYRQGRVPDIMALFAEIVA